MPSTQLCNEAIQFSISMRLSPTGKRCSRWPSCLKPFAADSTNQSGASHVTPSPCSVLFSKSRQICSQYLISATTSADFSTKTHASDPILLPALSRGTLHENSVARSKTDGRKMMHSIAINMICKIDSCGYLVILTVARRASTIVSRLETRVLTTRKSMDMLLSHRRYGSQTPGNPMYSPAGGTIVGTKHRGTTTS